jgi:uncharacterized protein (DUF302 family)
LGHRPRAHFGVAMRPQSTDPDYGYTAHLPGTSFEDARTRTVEALKSQGFGVLTEIDVQDTFKKKLDAEFRPYVILGACNPQLAHRALQNELGIGLLLPCNVCVWEEDGGSVVSIAQPTTMFKVVKSEALRPVADEADRRLQAALARIRENT